GTRQWRYVGSSRRRSLARSYDVARCFPPVWLPDSPPCPPRSRLHLLTLSYLCHYVTRVASGVVIARGHRAGPALDAPPEVDTAGRPITGHPTQAPALTAGEIPEGAGSHHRRAHHDQPHRATGAAARNSVGALPNRQRRRRRIGRGPGPPSAAARAPSAGLRAVTPAAVQPAPWWYLAVTPAGIATSITAGRWLQTGGRR